VKLPGPPIASPKSKKGSFFNSADDNGLEGDLSDYPSNHIDPTQASVLDSPKQQTRSPLPPSGSSSKRSGGKNPPSKDLMKDTPTERAIRNSLHRNRKATLRRSYGSTSRKPRMSMSSGTTANQLGGKKSPSTSDGVDDEDSDDSNLDLASMMKSIVKDINQMGESDSDHDEDMSNISETLNSINNSLNSDPKEKRRARIMRHTMMKQKNANHKVVAGEDFTFNDVLERLDDDDPDLTALIMRQSGQNMKNVEIIMGNNSGKEGIDDDEGELHETITLVLPMHLTATRMSEFAKVMSENSSLKSLDLRGNRITDESIVLISKSLRKSTTLENLNLSRNKITSTGATSLVQLVNKSLHTLDLSYNPIGDTGIQKLAGGIANTKTLKELHLTECKIKPHGASFLASAFGVNKSLHTISIGHNPMGGAQSSKRLAFALMKNSRLRVLNIGSIGIEDGIEHFARLLETTRSLKEMDLSANKIDDNGALALGNALTVNRSITNINLKKNKFGDLGLSTLSAALVTNTFISTLDVGGNRISDDGITKLCTVLSTATSVTDLDVSDNNIGIDGAFCLAEVIKSNKSLNIINIVDNPIATAGVMKLNEAIKTNNTLQACYIGAESVGHEGLVELCADEYSPLHDSRLIIV